MKRALAVLRVTIGITLAALTLVALYQLKAGARCAGPVQIEG